MPEKQPDKTINPSTPEGPITPPAPAPGTNRRDEDAETDEEGRANDQLARALRESARQSERQLDERF